MKYIHFTNNVLLDVLKKKKKIHTFPRAAIYSKCHYMSHFTVKCRDVVTSDFLAHQTDKQSLTPSIMSEALEKIAGVDPSCT